MDQHLANRSDAALLSSILEKDESRTMTNPDNKEKDAEHCKLLEKLDHLEQELKHEMETNDSLNDKNIVLKGKIRELKQLMKVRVLPVTVQHLSRKIQDNEDKIEKLREALFFAINLVPDSRLNKIHKDGLLQIHRNIY